ncbi:MAG: hypothetical protein GC185_08060 [Alphaproteobacteria bacterium]|nr:hypothetical protein [Alphaproteobacteria bacterium]
MSDDKNKAYQAGLYGQPYSGSNWNEYSSGSFARADGERRRREEQERMQRQQKEAAKRNAELVRQWRPKDADGPVSEDGEDGKALLFLLLLPVGLAGLVFAALGAALGVLGAPVLKLAERLSGGREESTLWEAYVSSFFSLAALGLGFAGTGLLIDLLGNYVMPRLMGGLTLQMRALARLLFDGQDVAFTAVAPALLLMTLTGLVSAAFVLRWRYDELFSGGRGILRGMLATVAMLAGNFAALCVFGFTYVLIYG